MRIFLDVKNEKTGFHLADYVTFKILSCCAPHNLWIIRDYRDERRFSYRKIVALMEVVAVIDGKEFHGQVANIALGNYGRLSNIIINLGEENTDYNWEQLNNPYCYGGLDVYIIDLDELRKSERYSNLSVDECFLNLLTKETIGYELITDRYVTNDGALMNADQICEE